MDLVLLAARLVLAAVFAVAAVAKFADRDGFRRAVEDFGVPAKLSAVVAIILPVVELGVAIALISTSFAWWGAVGALALLAVFTVVIVVNLARGRHPKCQCFGQLHAAPVGRSTLIRNLILAAIAGYVVWQGRLDVGASAIAWLFGLSVMEAAALIALVLVVVMLVLAGWLWLNLMRQHGRLLLRVQELEKRLNLDEAHSISAQLQLNQSGHMNHGNGHVAERLSVGDPAPGFVLPDLTGRTVDIADLRGHETALLFWSPACGFCQQMVADLLAWERQRPATAPNLVIVSTGSKASNETLGLRSLVLLDPDSKMMAAFGANGTPMAVLVNADGNIGSDLAVGKNAILDLINAEGSSALNLVTIGERR